MTDRTTMAPTVPQTMAFFCRWAGRWRAARAMTMALSPARTRSMRMMASSADHQADREKFHAERLQVVSITTRCRTAPRFVICRESQAASTEPHQVPIEGLARQPCVNRCPTSRKYVLRNDDLPIIAAPARCFLTRRLQRAGATPLRAGIRAQARVLGNFGGYHRFPNPSLHGRNPHHRRRSRHQLLAGKKALPGRGDAGARVARARRGLCPHDLLSRGRSGRDRASRRRPTRPGRPGTTPRPIRPASRSAPPARGTSRARAAGAASRKCSTGPR